MDKDNDKIAILELHPWGLGWMKANAKKPRGMDTVVLDKDLSQSLIEDIKWF